MPGSALIFLLIIAIWAAYLAQSWARYHEHAATARNVDKFSTAMRVLERRPPLPQVETADERVGQSVLPRPAAPEADVKPSPRPVLGASRRALPPPTNPLMPATTHIRVGLLVTSFLATLGLAVATLTLDLTWVAPVVAGTVLVGTLAWGMLAGRGARRRAHLEHLARARASRPMPSARPAASPQRPAARPAASRAARPEPAGRPARSRAENTTDSSRPDGTTVVEMAEPVTPDETATSTRRKRRELFDIDADASSRRAEPVAAQPATDDDAASAPRPVGGTAAGPAVQPAGADVIEPGPTDGAAVSTAADGTPVPQVIDVDDGWQPTPVPPPTYTMKAKAARRAVPVEELPFDGNAMVLDVEDEELPAVYKIG